jgi:hypothetical protein
MPTILDCLESIAFTAFALIATAALPAWLWFILA